MLLHSGHGVSDDKVDAEADHWIDIDMNVDNCAICRNFIMDPCVDCQANATDNALEECSTAWG